MNHRIKMKMSPTHINYERAPFPVKDKCEKKPPADRDERGVIRRPVQLHSYRRGMRVKYLPAGKMKLRTATIKAMAFIGAGKAAYILDDGCWCWESEVQGEA